MIRKLAWITAIAGWAVLVLRLWLMIPEMGLVDGLWRFLGFFTILTNIWVAVIASAIALGSDNFWTSAKMRFWAAVAIAFVGIAYWLLLASLWDPQGWVLVADIGLHTTQPLLFVLLWWLMHDGEMAWKQAAMAIVWPLIYIAYALARGAGDGWYAYWFLNPVEQGWGGMLVSSAGLCAVFLLLATLFWGAGRTRRREIVAS